MAKKRRKQNKNVPVTPESKKKFPIKKALTVFALVTVSFCFYQVMIYFEQIWIMHAYWIGVLLTAAAYIVINRGVFKVPKSSDISNELLDSEKDELIALIIKRRNMSMPVLYVLISLLFPLLYDTVYLFLTLDMGLKI